MSFLVSKPALADPSMPRWVRWLQPLLSGVFTVDNIDYVRRDAYLIGVATGPVDIERLRRYTFVGERGLTLYEPGIGALEMFLTARLFLYQQVYFHRTVRAIDLDLRDVFGPSIRAIFGDGSPAERLPAYADLDEYALLHQAARWARGESVTGPGDGAPEPGDGRVTPAVAETWQAILLRRPHWRSDAEFRAEYEAGERPERRIAALGRPEPGRIEIDLAEVDARPADATAGDRCSRSRAGRRTRGARQPGPAADAGVRPDRAPLPTARTDTLRLEMAAGCLTATVLEQPCGDGVHADSNQSTSSGSPSRLVADPGHT